MLRSARFRLPSDKAPLIAKSNNSENPEAATTEPETKWKRMAASLKRSDSTVNSKDKAGLRTTTTRSRTTLKDIGNKGTSANTSGKAAASKRCVLPGSKVAKAPKAAATKVKVTKKAAKSTSATLPEPIRPRKNAAGATPLASRSKRARNSKATTTIGQAKTLATLPLSTTVQDHNEAPPLMIESAVLDTTEELLDTVDLDPVDHVDIDAEDRASCPETEYVNEIYTYLRHLERKWPVKEDYLQGQKASPSHKVTSKMRTILVDWLVEVQLQFELKQETLYLAVAIFDRYMAFLIGQSGKMAVEKKRLQLLGVTSLFLAAKYEEMYPPAIVDFIYITKDAYSASDIQQCERHLLHSLDFSLNLPLAVHFLRRCSQAGRVDTNTHNMAKYAMEMALCDYTFAHVAPSLLAATSLAFALRILDPSAPSLDDVWTGTLRHYTKYRAGDLAPTLKNLASLVAAVLDKAAGPTSKMKAVPQKYSSKEFMKVAQTVRSRRQTVTSMAQGGK